MATATDGFILQNASATSAAFRLKGGLYALAVTATFGAGNVQLQTLAADAATWVNVGASITAAGLTNYTLPAGQYRISITTATAVYAALAGIPG